MSSPSVQPLGLSIRGAIIIRRVTVATVSLLALAAAVMSFAGLRELALRAGYSEELAWLFPLIVDGLVVTGSLGVVAASLVGLKTWYPWMLTWIGVIVSVVGNVAVANDDFVSKAVHATPPIVFALAIEGLVRIYRVGAQALVAAEGDTSHSVGRDSETGLEISPTVDEVIASAESLAGEKHNPERQTSSPVTDTKLPARDRLRNLLMEEPDITGGDAARRLGIDPSHARKLLREMRESATEG